MRKDISLRKCKEIDMTAFKKDIVDCFSCTGIDSSVEQQVEHYRGNLSNIFDKHAPVTIKSVVLRPNTEWYSDDLNNAKRDKRKAERKWRDSKLEVHHQIFKEKCRTFGKLLYIAKETYYSSKIENCGNDHKQLFKLTKHLMGKQQQTPLPSSSSDLELSNSFADFFVNKVVTIRDGLRDQNTSKAKTTQNSATWTKWTSSQTYPGYQPMLLYLEKVGNVETKMDDKHTLVTNQCCSTLQRGNKMDDKHTLVTNQCCSTLVKSMTRGHKHSTITSTIFT
ncbi:unnamed protein product [Mytilus edulis]|uniref:Uncharacterized protein n=1 Tax=Mytilus edulis TaxID=6550 RepID=A0A8S3SGF4_MYTED|nr:unnamed protein product [Mytilus edulis]